MAFVCARSPFTLLPSHINGWPRRRLVHNTRRSPSPASARTDSDTPPRVRDHSFGPSSPTPSSPPEEAGPEVGEIPRREAFSLLRSVSFRGPGWWAKMITGKDIYAVLTAMVPLYVAMMLAYGSVRWWRIFTPDQCVGINRFVAVFAVPLLSFHFLSANDPYAMDFRFLAADTLQKLLALAALAVWSRLPSRAAGGAPRLDWSITLFSVTTLPNTLVMGIPLLSAMYGPYAGSLMVQVIVLQCIIWYTLLLFLFEYRAARMLIADQFPDTASAIASVRVDPDVVSLDGGRAETEAEVAEDGRLHVTVRRSSASRRSLLLMAAGAAGTPRPSNLTGAEIYSVSSSRRGSAFNHAEFLAMVDGAPPLPTASAAAGGRRGSSSFGAIEVYSTHSSRDPTPRESNFDEHSASARSSKPVPSHDAKELHMFVWGTGASPVSEVSGRPVFAGVNAGGAMEIRMVVPADLPQNSSAAAKGSGKDGAAVSATATEGEAFRFSGGKTMEDAEAGGAVAGSGAPPEDVRLLKLGSSSSTGVKDVEAGGGGGGGYAADPGSPQQMPPAGVMTRLILIMVWRKLIRNPNTYSSIIGLTWSLIAFRWHITMPAIVAKSISILSDTGLGMAMFSLGLFMALQPKLIACGWRDAGISTAVRFLAGPIVMAVASLAIGLRGSLLQVAIVQAALPQGIVPFVFAKEYNLHAAILSTMVIFGMMLALPITLLYYVFLELLPM
ncbi:unnamed protein product [Urochloa humidicola]